MEASGPRNLDQSKDASCIWDFRQLTLFQCHILQKKKEEKLADLSSSP